MVFNHILLDQSNINTFFLGENTKILKPIGDQYLLNNFFL